MEIPFAGKYTRSDLLQALKLHHWPSPGMRILRIVLMLLVIVLYLGDPDLKQPQNVWSLLRALLPPVVGVLIIATPYLLPYGYIKEREQDPEARVMITGRATDNGIIRTEQRTPPELLWKWSMYRGYKQRGKIIILYDRAGAQYQIYTRTLFRSEADWQQFLALVTAHLTVKKGT
jgi:hypothetical protein